MPLIQSGTPAAISANIRDMMAHHPRAQAVAAALRTADEYSRGRAAGGSTGSAAPTVPTYGTAGNPTPGILSSGLMSVPQVGNYTIDTNTGALSPATQAALTSFAMRGLPPASAAPGYAPPAPAPNPAAALFSPPESTQQAGNRGGRMPHRAVGGPIGSLDSMATRSAFRSIDQPSGLVHGFGAGRTDTVPMSVAAGSHVVPSDVVSAGLGEGNTLAGAHTLGMAMKSGPGGISLPTHPIKAMGLPRPPRGFASGGEPNFEGHAIKIAKGDCPGGVKCVLANGEWLFRPDEVERITYKGERGHKAIDNWIVDMRAKAVKTQSKLPGPVGMEK